MTTITSSRWRLLPRISVGAWLVTLRHLTAWRKIIGASAVGNFGEPILYLLAIGFGVGGLITRALPGGLTYAEWVGSGLVASSAMYTASFEGTFGSYTRMETQRTFHGIIATPVSIEEVAAGEVIFCGIKAAFAAVAVLVALLILGLVPIQPSALLAIPVALLTGAVFGSVALVVTALSKSYETFNYFFTLFATPLFLFSGVFFPLQQLPPWALHVAWWTPLYHAVELSRTAVRGGPWTLHALSHLGILLAFGVVAFVPAVNLVRRRIMR